MVRMQKKETCTMNPNEYFCVLYMKSKRHRLVFIPCDRGVRVFSAFLDCLMLILTNCVWCKSTTHMYVYIYIYTYIQMPIYILAQIDWIWYRRWVPATPEDVLRSTGGLNSMWSRWSQRRQRERWTETELQAPPSRTSQSSCLQWHGRGSLLFGQLFLVKPVAPWLYPGLQTPTSFAPVYVNWMSSWNVWHEC